MATATKPSSKSARRGRVRTNAQVMRELERSRKESRQRSIKDGWATAEALDLQDATKDLWERAKLPHGSHSPSVHCHVRNLSEQKFGIEYKANFGARVLVPEGVELTPYALLWALIRDAEYHLENLRCRLNSTVEADRKAEKGGAK